MSIQNNELHFDSTGVTSIQSAMRSRSFFVGEYDLKIDYNVSNITMPSSSFSIAALLQIRRASDNLSLATVARINDSVLGDQYFSVGSDAASETYSTTDTTGSLRITRSGYGLDATTTVFIWSGSQWEWNGDPAGKIVSNDDGDNWVYARLVFSQAPNSALDTNIDNFTTEFTHFVCPESSSSSSTSSSSSSSSSS